MSDGFQQDLLIDSACDKLESSFRETGVFLEIEEIVEDVISKANLSQTANEVDSLRKNLTVELLCAMLTLDKQSGIKILNEKFPDYKGRVADELHRTRPDDFVSGDRAIESVLMEQQIDLQAGQTIGSFELTKHLGTGGMGIVWEARQTAPVKRKVALKFLQLLAISPRLLRRFQIEQQAMAVLKHPHIAQVYDVQATEDGHPFFVMELVDGVTLIEHAKQMRLNCRQRVDLFLPVCRAIHHAHQKGVIHRDIKPSNIVVARDGETARAKVIDFGLAKSTEDGNAITGGSLRTIAGQVLGTPDYMSPEQTRLDGNSRLSGVDTRTDVFSLGAVLYHLLTDHRPFEEQCLGELDLEDAVKTIRETNPVRPTLRTPNDQGFPKLGSLELEWIVMKCLEKDPSRRYDSAAQLGDDLQRYMNGEPIDAAPPSRRYRARKFIQKNRGLVASVAAVLIALTAGLIATGVALNWAWSEQVRANVEADEKSAALENLKLAQSETQQRASELENVSTFQAKQIQQIDPILMGIKIRQKLLENAKVAHEESDKTNKNEKKSETPDRPDKGIGSRLKPNDESVEKLSELLSSTNFTDLAIDSLERVYYQPATATIQTQFKDQPVIRARLLNSLGRALTNQGAFDLAKTTLEVSLKIWANEVGEQDIRYWSCLLDLAATDSGKGKFKSAIEKLERVVKACDRLLDSNDPFLYSAKIDLGTAIRLTGQTEPAEVHLRSAVDWLKENPDIDFPSRIKAIDEFATTLAESGKLSEAIKLMYETLESVDESDAVVQKSLVPFKVHFAAALDKAAKTRIPLEYKLTDLIKNQPNVSLTGEEEKQLRGALELATHVYGSEHPVTLEVNNQLGVYLTYWRDWSIGVPFFEKALEVHRRVLGKEHPQTIGVIAHLGVGHFHLKQYDKAIERHREAWIGLARILGPDDTATLTVQSGIGVNLRRKGEFEEAYRILEDVYVRGRRDANYDFFRTEFLEACIKAKKTERIKKLALEQYELSSKRFEKGSFDQSNDLVFAWSSLRRIGAWEDAEPILQESLEIMNRLKPDQWETFDRQSQFGECLVKTKKFDEAKEWLFSGHEGLKATFDDMPDNMKAKFGYSLDRIVEFYIATGDEALAADWQQKLDAFNLKMKENPSWR